MFTTYRVPPGILPLVFNDCSTQNQSLQHTNKYAIQIKYCGRGPFHTSLKVAISLTYELSMNQVLPLLEWAPPPLTKSKLRGRKPSRWNIDWMYYNTYFTSTFYHLDPVKHQFNVCKVPLFNFLIHFPRFDVETFPVLTN